VYFAVHLEDITLRKQLEQERAEQAEQLDRIFEHIADGLLVHNAQGQPVRVNAAARRILGLDAGPGDYAQLPAADRATLYEAHDEQGNRLTPEGWPLMRMLSGQVTEPHTREMRLRTLDGREVEVIYRLAPLQDQEAHVVGAVTILHDQTEQKRLEREREQALQSSEAWFRGMADTAPVLLWVAGTDALVTFVNAPWLRFTGRSLEQELGNGWTEGVHPDDYQRCLDTYLAAFQARQSFTMEYRLRRFDGDYRWVVDSGVPRYAADGSFEGYIGSAIDITEQKRLERALTEQAEQLDRIFEGISDGVVVYNAEGQLVRLNAEARRILGLDAAPAEYGQLRARDRAVLYEARDERGHRLVPEEWPLVRVLSGQVSGADSREVRLRMIDGRELDVISSAAPLRDEHGHLIGAVTILHDRTEQKQLAREREEAHAHELALEDTTRHMDEFLATASHDLRTPLTVVKSQMQLALRRFQRLLERTASSPEILPNAELEAVSTSLLEASHGTDRLTRLVAMLFDVAQARSGTLQLKRVPCDLAELVRRNVAAQQAAVPERCIELELPKAGVRIEADADRLDQVLTNYLTNALKYSAADQPVTVRLEVVENQAVVNVVDRGPGLPPEEQSLIWEVFHRVPGVEVQSGSGEASGSLGLGLHICKQLIEMHPGGSVGVNSAVGAGSTFWFGLPLAAS
jgi:PAS domain S-box-containing protein